MQGFDLDVIAQSLPFIGQGLLFSLRLTLVAMTAGIVLGTLLAMMRLADAPPLQWAAAAYVNTMRSIPLVMVILWFFLFIPLVTGRPLGEEYSAYITFSLFEAAFFAEIMRAGIQSVPRGQVLAASALGLDYWQRMRLIVLPQALRNMLPVLLTQTIVLFQDTSLVNIVGGAKDLLKMAEITGKNYNRPVEMYVFIALVYFAICFAASRLVKHLQKRTAVAR